MLSIFEGMKIPIMSSDTIYLVRQLGEDVSFTDQDRHIEAYEFKGHLYIASIQTAGPRE